MILSGRTIHFPDSVLSCDSISFSRHGHCFTVRDYLNSVFSVRSQVSISFGCLVYFFAPSDFILEPRYFRFEGDFFVLLLSVLSSPYDFHSACPVLIRAPDSFAQYDTSPRHRFFIFRSRYALVIRFRSLRTILFTVTILTFIPIRCDGCRSSGAGLGCHRPPTHQRLSVRSSGVRPRLHRNPRWLRGLAQPNARMQLRQAIVLW